MKPFISICILCLSIALPALAADANSDNGDQPHTHANELQGRQPIGKPGSETSVDRTIEVTITETSSGYMLFDPDAIHIGKGSVVRFVIKNFGVLDHEFMLGSFNEIEEHQKWMRLHPEEKHENANAVAISSGETAELVWQFSSETNLEFVCLIPGHREAGMWGVIMVHHHLAPEPRD